MSWGELAEWRISEIVGLILAIVALLVGVYHLVEIRRATSDVRAVQDGLSTRYVGNFPFFLKKIIELISSAQREIIIFCDYPAYADFSDPPGALAYRYAIEQQRLRKIKVELTCMDAKNRAREVNEQFLAADWTEWQSAPSKRAKVLKFLEARGELAPETKTRDDLIALMAAADEQTLQQVFMSGAVPISVPMPIYFWIIDRRSAIFSIPTVTEDELEYGFATSDHALIQALLRLRERYRKLGAV